MKKENSSSSIDTGLYYNPDTDPYKWMNYDKEVLVKNRYQHDKKKAEKHKWTDEQIDKLRELMPDHNCTQIAKKLKLTVEQVRHQSKKLSLV